MGSVLDINKRDKVQLRVQHPALCSLPASPGSYESISSDISNYKDGLYAPTFGRGEGSPAYAIAWREASLGSSASAYSLLGDYKRHLISDAIFPELTWFLSLATSTGSRHGQEQVQTVVKDCVRFLCLLYAVWLLVVCFLGIVSQRIWLTTLHQSVLFLLPIPSFALSAICLISAVRTWPSLHSVPASPPPIISPRATDSTMLWPAEQSMEAASFACEDFTKQSERTKSSPLHAAARCTCSVILLWFRHEVYLLFSSLVGGVSVFCITVLDSVLSSVLGPGDILVYSFWRSRQVGALVVTALFMVGSVALTVGCTLGVLWLWTAATISGLLRVVQYL